MTIRIERQALLRVISTSSTTPSPSPLDPPIPLDDDEFVIVDLPPEKKPLVKCTPSSRSTVSTFQNDYLDSPTAADDDSQTAVSSVLSDEEEDDDFSTESTRSRVSFSEELVTDVWTRPYTPTEDVPALFYSSDTIAQFRHEYRLERKVLSELAVDPETLTNVDEEQLSSLFSLPTSPSASSTSDASPSSSPSSITSPLYRISRVVVVHNDKLETFFNPVEEKKADGCGDDKSSSSSSSLPLSDSFCLGSEDPWQEGKLGAMFHNDVRQELLSDQHQAKNHHQQTNESLSSTLTATSSNDQSPPDDFFDNDSFWSGSLTWY